ncbi:hypothetical protein D9758_005432 [Tetrapyrgos nigripes]|uniref:Fungal-type protein kinase domain-containing protein n=1 Tax=Tetrapyrgos nigripes TaxID=182062 RepID=A0A8H5LPM8_9AGAR|nr:hypothetical protein D9758_005432 [Tetrapyrgos nigripes]
MVTRTTVSSARDVFHSCTLSLDDDTELELQDIIHRFHRLLGQGTLVLNAKRKKGNWVGDQVVVKISFSGENRTREDEFMKRVKEVATGDHAWALDHLPGILWAEQYKIRKDTPADRFAKLLHDELGEKSYEKRALRILVLRPLQPITNFLTDSKEIAQVFYDILQIHRWLVDHPKIFQRDIHLANIMFHRDQSDGKVYGVLNDLDLASWLPLETDHSSFLRTGTRPYMSHELLNPQLRKGKEGQVHRQGHLYHHDLESIYYVMVTFFTHYEKDEDGLCLRRVKNVEHYLSWFVSSNEHAGMAKHAALYREPAPFQPCFSDFRTTVYLLQIPIRKGY